MKTSTNKLLNALLLFIIMSSTLVYAGSGRLYQGQGGIDRINKEQREMVIGDQFFKVSNNVKVHSQFVTHDYFSRLKKGQQVKYSYTKNPETRYWYINEIWILK